MNDIQAKMAPGGKAESGKQKVEMAVGGKGKAPSYTQSACGGEGAKAPAIKIMSKIKIKTERNFANEVRIKEPSEEKGPPCTQSACGGEGAATMRMPEIDVRELSDEMLMFMLQLMAPEKYGKAATQVQKIRDQKPEVRDQQKCSGGRGVGAKMEQDKIMSKSKIKSMKKLGSLRLPRR